jgi:sugar lactone lactonase YvrE
LIGSEAANFAVVALDADDNLIVGPGAPALTVTSSSSSLTVAPVAGSPNKFSLTPVTEGGTVNLNVSVTNPGGSPVTSSVVVSLLAAPPTSLPVSLYAYESPNSGSTGEIDIFPPGSVNNATPARLTSTWLAAGGGVVAADTNGTVFASGTDTGGTVYALVSFASSAIGLNASPTTAIVAQYKGGPFANAETLAVGPSHNVYVNAQLDDNTYGIFVLAPGATGTASGQYQEIAGPATGIVAANGTPLGMAVDALGYIYVSMNGPGGKPQILVFAPGVYGNVAPVRVISGSNVTFQEPVPIGIAADGTLYILDYGQAVVYVFPPGANGNVTPERIFESPAMPYHGPMAVDANGNVYALNESSLIGAFPIVVFGATSSGIVNPLFTISGSNTLLNEPTGLSVPP